MKRDWNTIEVLRHARHDWLNQIQLIKGNISLNNIARVNEIIDEIVAESKHQSKLSNMNLPQFASLLLTCNWENHLFQLEFECVEQNHLCADDHRLANWTNVFFEVLDESIKKFHDNYLSITIESQAKGIGFFFDFSGIIISKDHMEDFLKSQLSLEIGVKVQQFSECELTLEFFLPNNETKE